MVVTCSEDAKVALNHVANQAKHGSSPVHTIEASWPMQRCLVRAVLSREREFSLLERYTLRAFHEIPGVSAAEIALKLGLKEPELIQEALDSLIRAEAIKTNSEAPVQTNLADLREELEHIEVALGANTYHGAVLRNMHRKAERLAAEIEQLENPKRLTWREKLVALYERFARFTATLTSSGIEQLRSGKIKEPARTEVYDLVRCLGTGSMRKARTNLYSAEHLTDKSLWPAIADSVRSPSSPNQNDIKQALLGSTGDEDLSIQSHELQNDVNTVVHLPVCITLAVKHEDNSAVFFVHRKGSTRRLHWIEEYLNNDQAAGKRLLNQFVTEMPHTAKGLQFAKAHLVRPIVTGPRYLNRAIASTSKGFVILNGTKGLIESSGIAAQVEELVGNRTVVEFTDRKTPKVDELSNGRLSILFPNKDTDMPKHAMATQDFHLQLVSVSVKPKGSKGNAVMLPAISFDEDLGNSTVASSIAQIRDGLEPKDRYLLTRSLPDFIEWLRIEVKGLGKVSDVGASYSRASELSTGASFDVFNVYVDAVFEERMDLFGDAFNAEAKDLIEQFHKVDAELNIWERLEPKIQESILRSVRGNRAGESVAEAWRAHASGEKSLPWEDAARLEHSWLGHCDSTKFRASRYFEESIFDLADKHGLTRENVAKALEALRGKEIISDTLYERADRVRKDRNAFTHTASLNADLDYTLRLIAVLRELADLGLPRKGGLWEEAKATEWSSVLTLDEISRYVDETSAFLSSQKHASPNGHVWVTGVRNSVPERVDELPFLLLEQLSRAPTMEQGPGFATVSAALIDAGLETHLSTLPVAFNATALASLEPLFEALRSSGLEDQINAAKSAYLERILPVSNVVEFMSEIQLVLDNEALFTPDDFTIRWKRGVKESTYPVLFDDLQTMPSAWFEAGALSYDVRDALFRRAVRGEVRRIEVGDVLGVKSLCGQFERFVEADDAWSSMAKAKDGFFGAEISNRIRAGNDLISAGEAVKNQMPFVDEKVFKKTHARLEEIIRAGEKAAKAAAAAQQLEEDKT